MSLDLRRKIAAVVTETFEVPALVLTQGLLL
jgi:hypothetical protein